ncbi:MAG: adenosine deaminase [Bacteriovoracaceae bacterium]|nr:adenosine deaminase [Bacteriovoracaceae bacterium]
MEKMKERIKQMPKTEIHVHVEGATTPETMWEIAKRNKIKLPAKSLEEWKSFYAFKDFKHFIEIYILAATSLKTADDYAFLLEEFCRYQASQNILYTEAFLSASLFVNKIPTAEMLKAIKAGLKRGQEKYQVEVALLPDISREQPKTQKKVLDFVLEGFHEKVFLGLGLGGIEDGFPPELFTETFAQARAAGMHVVAHAGENMGPESIRGSIESLKAERIGHGIRCLEDPKVVELLRKTQTPLEVCPTSNYCTGVVKKGEPHPLKKILEAGVYCTINSDDPPMFMTSLTQEYLYLLETGFSWEQIWQLNCNNLKATFLSSQRKNTLMKKWDEFYKS